MKYLIILGDGMADEPIPELGGKTPLQATEKPEIDWLAEHGRSGLLDTIPEGFAPGSEIANLAILGYNLNEVFEGRGSLEAASMGVKIEDGEMAMRCNLITIEDGKIKNHSGGQISSPEAAILIQALQDRFGGGDFNFFPGVSYRHLLKMKGGDKAIITTPPHDVIGEDYRKYLVKAGTGAAAAKTAERLNRLTEEAMKVLEEHPVNVARRKAGKDVANSIWPWSPGYRPKMKTLQEQFPEIRSGSVISAVDLIKGIGVYAGLTPIEAEGATGLYDTNYEGKAEAALKALKEQDFVFLHLEASDEAGHDGDPQLKMTTIRYLNDRIVRPILNGIRTWNEDVSVAILPDHPTPCAIRTHTAAPVPFTIYRTGGSSDNVRVFDEFSAREGSYGQIAGRSFIELFLSGD